MRIRWFDKGNALVTPDPLTKQEEEESKRLCVFIVCCNPGSKDEISFATELFPCPRRVIYEDKKGSLEIVAGRRTIQIPNARGWQNDNPTKILIHRQFNSTPEDVEAFRRDPLWTQVRQQIFQA